MEFTFPFCARSMLSEPFVRFSCNFTHCHLGVCRTHDSATLTQGQGYASILWDSAAGDLAVLQTAILSSGKHILLTHIGENQNI